ncbi:MAG: hypothetical protein KJZ72_13725 [Anaerolineales bacterium]|nr:hypothetical protein [Anaerolineales bacterium]
MPTINLSGWKTLPDEKRVSLGWVAPTVAFAGVVARVESLRGRMPPSGMIYPDGHTSEAGLAI